MGHGVFLCSPQLGATSCSYCRSGSCNRPVTFAGFGQRSLDSTRRIDSCTGRSRSRRRGLATQSGDGPNRAARWVESYPRRIRTQYDVHSAAILFHRRAVHLLRHSVSPVAPSSERMSTDAAYQLLLVATRSTRVFVQQALNDRFVPIDLRNSRIEKLLLTSLRVVLSVRAPSRRRSTLEIGKILK